MYAKIIKLLNIQNQSPNGIGGYVQKGGHCAAKQIKHKTMMQMYLHIASYKNGLFILID